MYSPVIERAMRVSIAAHDGQLRKGTEGVPYVVHPMHVAMMLARWGLEEDVIVAGLLHDVVEDCEAWTRERVQQEFGAHVASIVAQLTEDKSLTWEERKRRAVEDVPHMSPEAASVKAVDKLHNLQSLLEDLRRNPDADQVWRKFRGGREQTLQHARELVGALTTRIDPRIARVLNGTLEALVRAAGGQPRASAPRA
jgi:(p)ppGpp synthase/HD superfamily hydrolase